MNTDLFGTTWVYRCYCDCNHRTLLYVGVAVDVERRLSQHARTKQWWQEVDLVMADRYPTRRRALRIESWLIETLSPKYNIVGVPVAPANIESDQTQMFYRGASGLRLDRIIDAADVQ